MKIKTQFKIVLAVFFLSFLFSNFVLAAVTSFEIDTTNIKVGDTVEANLVLNTEGVSVNAVEGTITIPGNIFSLKGIKDGNSLVNFWIEKPSFKDGGVSFSGIVPGGYTSSKGLILSVVFQAVEAGDASLEIKNMKILANDGQGTPIKTTVSDLNFKVLKLAEKTVSTTSPSLQISQTIFGRTNDVILPENFTPKIVSDSNMFDGQYFLVFATQDKGSGIDHYEVLEKKIFNLFNHEFVLWETGWTQSDSPYVLADQTAHSFIYVKAVDKNGNGRVVTVSPRNPIEWFEVRIIWCIIVGVLIVLLLGLYIGKRIICRAK